MTRFVPLQNVRIDDPFWAGRQRLVRERVLPYQWEILNDRVPGAAKSHCVENFRIAAGQAEGAFEGAVFQDSDLYKWLEAVAYVLATYPDPALDALVDEAIALVGAAQQSDGYLNTYYTVAQPDGRWRNLMEGHELYCAGHLIEAAVAHFEATGKRALLDIACRFADHIDATFGLDKRRGYPGHPEIELALVRLYDATEEARYLRLAAYFVNERGQGEDLFGQELAQPDHHAIWAGMYDQGLAYFQAHAPVRDQEAAAGHAVRAMYLYSAMADLAARYGDPSLRQACERLFANTTARQMYVTGGIGAAAGGERFTTDYDLPNDSVYAETCASIGLMMFARRMWLLDGEAARYDAYDRALYNTVLAGMDQAGEHFFYVNPLSVVPAAVRANPTLAHVKPVRPRWFGCACCPPNLARTVASLGGQLYGEDDETLYILSPMASTFDTGTLQGALGREGDRWTLALRGNPRKVRVRVPEYHAVGGTDAPVKDGYLTLAFGGGEGSFCFTLTPQMRLLRANSRVAADAGKVCVQWGQQVYCLEAADNPVPLSALSLPGNARMTPVDMDWLPEGMRALKAPGYSTVVGNYDTLYTDAVPVRVPQLLTFVPYSQWGNRGEGEMTVWVCEANGEV